MRDVDRQVVDAVAERVVDLLLERSVPIVTYVDTATVARMLSVNVEWVREHAVELGAVRVGDGRNGSLRFHVDRVVAAVERRRVAAPAANAAQPRRRRRGGGRNVELLPLPDDVAA